MAKLTEEKIQEIREAYRRIGTYSGVAKEVGCSAATVKKYCNQKTEAKPKDSVQKILFDKEIPFVESINFSFERTHWTILSEEEIIGVKELQKEV